MFKMISTVYEYVKLQNCVQNYYHWIKIVILNHITENLLFIPSSSRVDTAVWMHYLDANKTAGEEARRQLDKNVATNIE